jgi:hypothetical protein
MAGITTLTDGAMARWDIGRYSSAFLSDQDPVPPRVELSSDVFSFSSGGPARPGQIRLSRRFERGVLGADMTA